MEKWIEPGDKPGWVMLVEDQELLRMTAASYLRIRGYEVIEAEDAAQALNLLAQNPAPAILVTDLGLPGGLNGRQLADAARLVVPALPVLFTTGYTASSLGQLEDGMELLSKPFELRALSERVAAMLAG